MWKCPSKLKLDGKCAFHARGGNIRALYFLHLAVTVAFGSSTVARKTEQAGHASGFGYFSLPWISFTKSKCSWITFATSAANFFTSGSLPLFASSLNSARSFS
jgi:hypothetical protein